MKKKENFLKVWACKKPVLSVTLMSMFYLVVALSMITVNAGNIINNGIIAMIAVLFAILGVAVREIFENIEDISKNKKITIWIIFGLTVAATVLYGLSFGM